MQDNPSVIQKIRDNNPQLIYISGKTCTGKTTLARLIKDTFDSGIVELDNVVRKIDAVDESQKFVDAYRHRNNMELVTNFVRLAKSELDASLLQHPMVLFEGAIANSETLSEIVEDTERFLFVYLLPVNLDVYKARITERFLASSPDNGNGLPGSFWKHLDSSELATFYKTKKISANIDQGINAYTIGSMKEAKTRLTTFSKLFTDIVVVEI